MLLEKIDRLESDLVATADTAADGDSNTHLLITNNVATDEDAARLEAALETVKASSATPVTLWHKYSKNENYTQAVRDMVEPAMITAMAKRRINSFGAICDRDSLPEGWKAMVFLPTQHQPRVADNENDIRRTIPWAGVRDNGLLVSGSYVPSGPVMTPKDAFEELGTGIMTSDISIVPKIEMSHHNLDGYKNASAWRTKSVDTTHNAIYKSRPGHLKLELAQNDNKRFRDNENFEDHDFQDRADRIFWQTARATAETFKGKELGTKWACQRALEEAMDTDALKLARLSKTPTAREYNWVLGANTKAISTTHYQQNILSGPQALPIEKAFERDPETATRRQQAMTLFPLLARGWLSPYPKPDTLDTLDIIDNGGELVPHLADKHRVTTRHIKAINGLHWQRTGNQDSIKDPTSFLQTLPVDHMPSDKKEWAAWRKTLLFATDLRTLSSDLTDAYTHPPDNIYQSANYDHAWKDGPVVATLAPRYTAMDKALGNYTPGGARDMLAHMRDTLILPIMKNAAYQRHAQTQTSEQAVLLAEKDLSYGWNSQEDVNAATNSIAKLYSMRQLADSTTRWHHNLTAINDHVHDPELPHIQENWEGVTGDVPLAKGLVARELTSARDLRIQGMVENHCVGGYTDQVLSNTQDKDTTLIYSVEDPEKRKILSTVEVKVIHDTKRKAQIIQNYAAGNSTASPEATKAANGLCRHLRKLDDTPFLKHFASTQNIKANRNRQTITLTHNGETQTVPSRWINSGYDPRNQEKLQKAFDAYKSMLPKALGKSLSDLENHLTKQAGSRTKSKDPLEFF